MLSATITHRADTQCRSRGEANQIRQAYRGLLSEGPPNALKPTQIAYTQSPANVTGEDGEIFRICLKWQVLQLIVGTIAGIGLVLLWK